MVLDHKRAVPEAPFESSPFSVLGGDLLDAALLAHLMQQKNFDVSLDDVLKNPSLILMARFVERRQKAYIIKVVPIIFCILTNFISLAFSQFLL